MSEKFPMPGSKDEKGHTFVQAPDGSLMEVGAKEENGEIVPQLSEEQQESLNEQHEDLR